MPKEKEKEEKEQPDHVRDGALEVTIWKNKSKDGRAFNTFTAKRGYRDDKGEWKDSTSFRRKDLLPLGRLLEQAFEKTQGVGKGEKEEEEV